MKTTRMIFLGAALVFSSTLLASCSDSTGPDASEAISLALNKSEQTITITNNTSDRVDYSLVVGGLGESTTLFTLCPDPDACHSIKKHSSVTVRYADIPIVIPGSTLTFSYWPSMLSTSWYSGDRPVVTQEVSMK